MLQHIIIWLIESIQFGYPVVLILLVILYISKIKIKIFDKTLFLQIINVLTAVCALGILLWNFEYVTSAFDKNIINNVNPKNGNSSVLKVMAFIFILCDILLPQLFWIKRIRTNIWISFFIMLLMNSNAIMMRYTIFLTGRDIFTHDTYFVITGNSFFHNIFPGMATYLALVIIIYLVNNKVRGYKLK